jgi:hypothetical protein
MKPGILKCLVDPQTGTPTERVYLICLEGCKQGPFRSLGLYNIGGAINRVLLRSGVI